MDGLTDGRMVHKFACNIGAIILYAKIVVSTGSVEFV